MKRISVITLILAASALSAAEPSVVKIVKKDDAYQLQRNGEPYFIKGVGGDGSL